LRTSPGLKFAQLREKPLQNNPNTARPENRLLLSDFDLLIHLTALKTLGDIANARNPHHRRDENGSSRFSDEL
jgi:hypothetical protein